MDNWRKSSHSGPDDGNECVEIANSPTHVSIRDSKTPSRATLTFRTGAFAAFVETVRTDTGHLHAAVETN
ncbi:MULTISPECIES: DUF397 domain-containing protein [Streptomyces]|uniref:DUF397 domain-containing protein n=1 Tax=Streptomyces sviceus (strain ATCC 29083 / DSM 924 / JCM 4929 / NBRC 13980 / NCIMB 11184 / NRRL 5439 / UC 5370) TaxID=463191 RepID=B5HX01_STRX2|nr:MULTISPECIES: DUF397 domain-containing protein [Streptomyces]EDY57356.1 conserved hypothetical protein [Streptomyces sviceus ATCC 29083]MYT06348.1 DUF397 domain-containing protein [Streptomyces sp. SID5470]